MGTTKLSRNMQQKFGERVRATVLLDPDLSDKLKRTALKEGLSISTFIARLIEQRLTKPSEA